MTKHFCDVCKREVTKDSLVKIEFLDGEHPHNGSAMHKTAELCHDCLIRNELYLTCNREFGSLHGIK